MSAEHLDRRVANARAQMIALDADAMLVSHLSNVAWLTGVFASAAALVLTRTSIHLLTDFRYQESVAQLSAARALPTGTAVTISQKPLDDAAVEILESAGA